MRFEDFDELYYITPISNLASISANGILSNHRAARMPHESVALEDVQKRRAKVRVPIPGGSRSLHSYANLYFSARNPMMFKRKEQHRELCVVRIRKDVLRLAGIVVADCNAASDDVRWGDGLEGVANVNKDLVFAKYWTDDDPIAFHRKRLVKCAEVLVPDIVERGFLSGAYVSIIENVERLKQVCRSGPNFAVSVNRHMFFL